MQLKEANMAPRWTGDGRGGIWLLPHFNLSMKQCNYIEVEKPKLLLLDHFPALEQKNKL